MRIDITSETIGADPEELCNALNKEVDKCSDIADVVACLGLYGYSEEISKVAMGLSDVIAEFALADTNNNISFEHSTRSVYLCIGPIKS